MTKNYLRNRGITLIALVITVIVLLILAETTIAMLTGENGIIKQAIKAKESTKVAEQEEQKQLDEMQEIMESSGNDYIKNDELDENEYLKTFITEWTVNDGDTIVLPIYQKQEDDAERGEKETYFNYDFSVDYGDGTIVQVKSFDDENRKHTYKQAGKYNVKINGKCAAFSFNYVGNSKDKITKLVQWGAVFAKHYDFANCTNLAGTIPLPSKNSFMYVESFRMLFYKCENLTGTIPNNLFKYAPNVITMANIFNYTTGLQGTIPNQLFYGCDKITNFRFAFAGSNLSGKIPENLFANNEKANNFSGVFKECQKLRGILPKNIFKNNEEITILDQLLYGTPNVYVDVIYLKSEEIISAESMGIIKNYDEEVTFYVPKDSKTETTIRRTYDNYNNVIIENI